MFFEEKFDLGKIVHKSFYTGEILMHNILKIVTRIDRQTEKPFFWHQEIEPAVIQKHFISVMLCVEILTEK